MVRHIGIVAVSSEGASLCYRTICREAPTLMGRFAHPDISIHTPSFKRYMDFLHMEDWEGVASLLKDSIARVVSSGAEFAIIPDNTVHRVFEEVSLRAPVPLISIAEVVAEECETRGYRTVGVLGTNWIMRGPVYPQVLRKRGIRTIVPEEAGREIVNSVIFNDLVPGSVKESSTSAIIGEIERLEERGCEAVILGCTEIPIIINSENSPIPIIDSTRLLARKALQYAFYEDKMESIPERS